MQGFQQGIKLIAGAGMYRIDRTVQDVDKLLGDLLKQQLNDLRRGLTMSLLMYYNS